MKNQKLLYGILLAVVFVMTTGLTYAYFSLVVSGNQNAKTMTVNNTTLELKYTDGNEINATGIEPGWTTTKTIIVENTGNETVYYTLGWQKLYNGFEPTNVDELVIRSSCTTSDTTNGSCDSTKNVQVPSTNEVTAEANKILYPYKEGVKILSGETHTYTVTIEFINYPLPQNYNQGKSFYGTLGVVEAYNTYNLTLNIKDADGNAVANSEVTLHSTPMSETTDSNGSVTFENVELGDHTLDIVNNSNTITTKLNISGGISDVVQTNNKYNTKSDNNDLTLNVKLNESDINALYVKGKRKCTTDESATTFVDGQYTYTYSSNTWGVKLTDATSTDEVTTEICYMINDKYVTNMSGMFSGSKATSIDLGGFDTSNVTNMSEMFFGSEATSIDLGGFDTSNVTNMSHMFAFSNANAASFSDVTNFDTSNVTDMSRMFMYSKLWEDTFFYNFNTSKVTDMSHMFEGVVVGSLRLTNFDTSNVTNMIGMFANSTMTHLDLRSFNTSNVTDMNYMFWGSRVEHGTAANQEEADKFNTLIGSNVFYVN